MSEIRAGDLVMVVRGSPCCGNASKWGHTFTVQVIDRRSGLCATCAAQLGMHLIALDESKYGWSLGMLKKIDPPALPESTEAELTA